MVVTTMGQRMPPPGSEKELLLRAQALEGRSVAELATALGARLPTRPQSGKGFVGQLVELALGSDSDAHERPDFVALGIELKTVPVDVQRRPKEGTFVCSINLQDAATANWAGAKLRIRLQRVLWVPVLAAKEAPLGVRTFFAPTLWSPTGSILQTLRADWEDLMGAIGAGRGPSLSAYEGQLLQVRPKAAHAGVRVIGPRQDGAGGMMPLGFYLRPQFVAKILAGAP